MYEDEDDEEETPEWKEKLLKADPRSARHRDVREALLAEQRREEIARELDRGKRLSSRKIKGLRNRQLKQRLERSERTVREATSESARMMTLMEESGGGMEGPRTDRVRQPEIVRAADSQTADMRFDLTLDKFGPYVSDYSPDGRYLLLAGRLGHVAVVEWYRNVLSTERHVRDEIFAARFLHSHETLALAQGKYTFIYDHNGTELHKLKTFARHRHLEFLRNHFLLVGGGLRGIVQYLDVSTGREVARQISHKGPVTCMTQNPRTGVVLTGHGRGRLQMWTPTSEKPVVDMLCHNGSLRCVAVHPHTGLQMATVADDGVLKVWDIRMFRELYQMPQRQPISHMAVSGSGMLAVAFNNWVNVYRDPFTGPASGEAPRPYLRHGLPHNAGVSSLGFARYEDVLGIGHERGFASILVPGAGQVAIDSRVLNPYSTRHQRREIEVQTLLEKLPPDTISLNPGGYIAAPLRPADARTTDEPTSKWREANKPRTSAVRGRRKARRMQRRKVAFDSQRDRERHEQQEERAKRRRVEHDLNATYDAKHSSSSSSSSATSSRRPSDSSSSATTRILSRFAAKD